jgi:hypothetical protein
MDFILFLILGTVVYVIIRSLLNSLNSEEKSDKIDINLRRAYYKNTPDDYLSENENTRFYRNKTINTKTYINENGYRCFKDSNILVHRWIMSKHLNRRLYHGEIVHHIDGNKLNNKLSNLKLFSSQHEHTQHHLNHLKNYGSWYEKIPEYVVYR